VPPEGTAVDIDLILICWT